MMMYMIRCISIQNWLHVDVDRPLVTWQKLFGEVPRGRGFSIGLAFVEPGDAWRPELEGLLTEDPICSERQTSTFRFRTSQQALCRFVVSLSAIRTELKPSSHRLVTTSPF